MIDLRSAQILYGDPLQVCCPDSLVSALQHWLALHTDMMFTMNVLSTPQQTDGHLCGLLLVLALGHYHALGAYEHVDAWDADALRMQMLLPILEKAWHSGKPPNVTNYQLY